ncbi:aminotransferase class V-fold PLP-dependent enzyme [Arthrobacter sp. HMWF013]|uniref:aminotransferase class V-fold PLP-dependent enzyme n=1 Tax=Arthrobacter sp. HMWF013 TaxID=2056849 RepID=UPI001C635CC3
METLRRKFAKFINASPEEIAIVPSASEGAYQVASSFSWASRERDAIVTSALEFPSVGHVWRAQQAQGVRIKSVEDRFAALDANNWARHIDDSVQFVSVPLVSYHDGSRAPLGAISALAREAGAQVFVDAYQGAGVVPIDVRAMDCDYLVTGTLKYMLGLAGVAFIYVRDGIASERAPELTGWFGRVNPFEFNPDHVDYPKEARRFESGTPAIPAVYAANAGLDLLATVDQARGYEHVEALAESLADQLLRDGERLSRPGSPELCGPQVAIYDEDPVALSAFLHDRRVMSAPRGELLRLSVHYYTTTDDITAVVDAVRAYRSR